MPTRLLIAPAAAGKTADCIRRAIEAAHTNAGAPVWAVLPDRVQVRYFRRRLAAAGGAIGVRVGTFGDLYRTILDIAGQPRPLAQAALVYRLVRMSIDEAGARGEIDHYASIAGLPGFGETIRKAISELKRARVPPGRLLDEGRDDPRLAEVARIYAAYEARLGGTAWIDAEGLDGLAIDALESDPGLVAGWALVAVDGFDDFEPARRDALVALARGVGELIVTLPGTREGARPAHRRFRRTLEALVERFEGSLAYQVDYLDGPPDLPAPLWSLEQQLFEPTGDGGAVATAGPLQPAGRSAGRSRTPAKPPEFVAVASPAEEAREALRWIKARHVRDKVALAECAIVTPEPERYRPLLREAAAELGVAIRFTEGEPLITAPAATALADLLDLPRFDFPRRQLADTLRSPYFTLPKFEPGDATAVEAISRANGVASGLDRWLAALDRLAAGGARDDGDDGAPDGEDGPAARLPRGAVAARLRESVVVFASRLDPPPAQTMHGWVAWLEALLHAWQFAPEAEAAREEDRGEGADWDFEPATEEAAPSVGFALGSRDDSSPGGRGAHSVARTGVSRVGRPPTDPLATALSRARRRDKAVFEHILDALRALVIGETVVGAVPRSYESFVGELRGLLETETYLERPARDRDCLLVTKVLESRGPRFRAVTMLGLSEGLFPQIETEDPLIGEDVRRRLGLEPRLDREQRGLFYLVATRADAWLRFSRPHHTESGEPWAPSPYWKAALDALGRSEADVVTLRPDDPRAWQDAASPSELLFWVVRRGRVPKALKRPDLIARLDHLRHTRDVLRARLAAPGGPFDGDASALAGTLAASYGPDHLWSPSRLESYGMCGLRFYTESVLGLQADALPEPGPDARQLGTLLHRILEQAYLATPERDRGDPEAVITALGPIAAAEFAAAPARDGFEPTAYWQAEQAVWLERLENTVRALDDPPGQWRPAGFEVAFGFGDAPALVVHTGDPAAGAVRVRGIIDRVDRDGAGNLRVVDYKTGSSHLAPKDLLDGRRLQLPLYALAADDMPHLGGRAVEGLYWAIRAGKAGELRLSRFARVVGDAELAGPEGAMDLARSHIARAVTGVRAARFAPRPPADGCPSYCAAAAWCWRYTPGRAW